MSALRLASPAGVRDRGQPLPSGSSGAGRMTPIVKPGEDPSDALRRLERLPGPLCAAALETEAGQALLRVLRERAAAARRLTRREVVA